MDSMLGWMSERSSCSASFGNVKISDVDFEDDAIIFAETLDILMGTLEVLNEESEALGLRASHQYLILSMLEDGGCCCRPFVGMLSCMA